MKDCKPTNPNKNMILFKHLFATATPEYIAEYIIRNLESIAYSKLVYNLVKEKMKALKEENFFANIDLKSLVWKVLADKYNRDHQKIIQLRINENKKAVIFWNANREIKKNLDYNMTWSPNRGNRHKRKKYCYGASLATQYL
jgi:hypothetical protein